MKKQLFSLCILLCTCLLLLTGCMSKKEADHFSVEKFRALIEEQGIVAAEAVADISGDIDTTTSYLLPAIHSTQTPIYLIYSVDKDTDNVVAVQLNSKKESDGNMQQDFVDHARELITIMDSSLTQQEADEYIVKLRVKQAGGEIELNKGGQVLMMRTPNTGVVFAVFPQR